MLRQLSIQNLAVIADLSLDFGNGFNVLTGETGAGKSILIDAISLVLGHRADSDAVRTGEPRAQVDAAFDLAADSPAGAWLRDQALDDPDDPTCCLIRRVVMADGGSRAFINGSPANIRSLRELGEHLVDIHGQHDSQRLLDASQQRALLDAYGRHDTALQTVAARAADLKRLRDALAAAQAAGRPSQAEIELLEFQLNELDAAAPEPGEFEQLDQEQRRLANAEQLMRDAAAVIGLLTESDDGAAIERSGKARDVLADLESVDSAFAEARELVDSATIQLEDAARLVSRQLDRMELDPDRLQVVDERLTELHRLARKHDCKPETLPELVHTLRHRLDQATHAGDQAARLQQEIDAALVAYKESAQQLTRARSDAAMRMQQAITDHIRTLGMPDAQVRISVRPDSELVSPQGSDRITFEIAANPGQTARPLARVASGGELSRLALSIQLVVLGDDAAPTMIFDEVDAGIGGAVAEIVGRRLAELSSRHQVLCVTHLPQVAAQGQQQYHVSKQSSAKTTRTRVEQLLGERRVEEIARMLGGVDVTERTRAHAREMLGLGPAPA
ncbi:MAG: DNA repair protein RecN [Abyssibacter sp.]|uniref:DNA repair protein RecN n=1 Tax=Abyssibacter sp. TaxID=2320200 RepID=UPI00321A979D